MSAQRVEAVDASSIPVGNIALGGPLFPGGEVSYFQSPTDSREYRIETYRSGNESGFVRRISEGIYGEIPETVSLLSVVCNLYPRIYPERVRKNPELTTKRIMKGLSYPRTLLKLAVYEDQPIGYGIFPRLDIDGEPVLYSSRAFLLDHEKHGLGTHVLGTAIEQHRRDSAKGRKPLINGMLMTQKWESIRTLEHLQEQGIIERIQPIGEPFDEEGKRILYGVHAKMWVSSSSIDENGKSEAELVDAGANETATIPEEGTRGREIFDKMTQHPPRGAGLNLPAGDVLYVRFTFPVAPIAPGTSMALAAA